MSPNSEVREELEETPKINVPLKGEDAFRTRFAKMAAPLQQKVGAMVVFLPTSGTIIDVGCADGPITEKLADLCPNLKVIGIDNEERAIKAASERELRPNLSFRLADASEPIFDPETIDGFVLCSTAHELASFMKGGINGLWEVLDRATGSLKVGGRIVIRDFVVPHNGKDEVTVVVPLTDGKREGTIMELSTGAMLKKFLSEFRSSFYENGKIPYASMIESEEHLAVRVTFREGAEFALKKDYRQNWDHEVTEQFLHFTQEEIVKEFLKRGLRVHLAAEIHNPWIRENSFDGKICFHNGAGKNLEFPPTNFLIAGEKTDKGILFIEKGRRVKELPNWNTINFYKRSGREGIWELASRKHDRVHILPWYVDEEGGIQVLLCDSYPRPIVNSKSDSPNLDRSYTSGYLMELPYEVIPDNKNATQTISSFLNERELKTIHHGPTRSHLTSPVDLLDQVTMASLEIEAPDLEGENQLGSKSGWSENGTLRSFPAQQILRSAHIGAVSEPEMERAVYRLLVDQALPVGPWIGASISLREGERFFPAEPRLLEGVFKQNKCFELLNEDLTPKFQLVIEGEFTEVGRDSIVIGEQNLEYIHPRELSNNKFLITPLRKGSEGKIYVGLERRDLPSMQVAFGDASSFSLPEYRLPKDVISLDMGRELILKRLKDEFGISASELIPLGGKYFSSPSISPEVTYPFGVEVLSGTGNLYWFPLEKVVGAHSLIRNGHTLTGIFRAAHATGVLEEFSPYSA